MKKRPALGINVSLVNEVHGKDGKREEFVLHKLNETQSSPRALFPINTTYRDEGISIGKDYMRIHQSEAKITNDTPPETIHYKYSPNQLRHLSEIGYGSCSVVKQALTAKNKMVALKIFPLNKKEDMLIKEIKILSRLCRKCNECIIQLYGAYYDNGCHTIHLVLEFMDMGSLDRILYGGYMQDYIIAAIA